jgi:hypothetical protein
VIRKRAFAWSSVTKVDTAYRRLVSS